MSEPDLHPMPRALAEKEEEAPRVEPAGVVDELFAIQVRETRERLKMSQGELARQMSARGFPYYQQTVRRIEDSQRKVSVGEAKALAQILGTSMDRLTWPGREASAAALLDMSIARAERAYQQIASWTATLLWALGQLGTTVGETEGKTFRETQKMQEILGEAADVLQLTPEAAVEMGRKEHEEGRGVHDEDERDGSGNDTPGRNEPLGRVSRAKEEAGSPSAPTWFEEEISGEVAEDSAAQWEQPSRDGRTAAAETKTEPVSAEEVGYRGPTACAAAGITYKQLDYWARTGLVEPSVRAGRGSGSQRLYSFRDILVLKVVKRLLDTGISLQQIRAAVQHLRNRGTEDLSQVTLMSDGISVYECTSADEVVHLLQGNQGVFGIALGRVWHEVEADLAVLPAVRAEEYDDGAVASETTDLGSEENFHVTA
jgi:DNA-binding transcriptional MerR regulator/transcriptional regulator with XRE-family HTH domain